MAVRLVAFDFEVFGRVQRVFFRKCTADEATKLGLKGWCMNTQEGTVQGQAEGPEEQIKLMKHYLQHVGSPMSQIDKAEFKNERTIDKYSFDEFSVRKVKRN